MKSVSGEARAPKNANLEHHNYITFFAQCKCFLMENVKKYQKYKNIIADLSKIRCLIEKAKGIKETDTARYPFSLSKLLCDASDFNILQPKAR